VNHFDRTTVLSTVLMIVAVLALQVIAMRDKKQIPLHQRAMNEALQTAEAQP